jgi:hypothetical protein
LLSSLGVSWLRGPETIARALLLERSSAMKKIKIEVLERAGWWQVRACGLRHSRYRSQAAARHGARLLAARVRKLRALGSSTYS